MTIYATTYRDRYTTIAEHCQTSKIYAFPSLKAFETHQNELANTYQLALDRINYSEVVRRCGRGFQVLNGEVYNALDAELKRYSDDTLVPWAEAQENLAAKFEY